MAPINQLIGFREYCAGGGGAGGGYRWGKVMPLPPQLAHTHTHTPTTYSHALNHTRKHYSITHIQYSMY